MADNDGNGQKLASFLQNVKLPRDMEIGVRGDDGQVNWVAPNKGAYPLSHISTFQAVVTTAARTYRESDEAVRASLDNTRFMRNDCGIMECLESRQRCTALLNWHIEPEDDTSQEQKDLAADMTKIMTAIPRFTEYRRVLLEALWYGKHAIQHRYGWQQIGGHYRVLPTRRHHLDIGWQPINGDKIVFRFDDGNLPEGAFEGQMGIRVGAGHWGMGDLVKNRWKVEATERGMAYFLSEAEAKLIAVHRHMIEDAAFEDVRSAAFLHGVGIRSRIYWEWVQKQESLAFLMEYLERSAGGIELWHFPSGNDKAKEEVREAATERLSNSRNVTLVPIPPGDEGSQYGVQIIEPGMAGIECLKDLLEKYFGHRIKRYILGQTLTSEADATGLGSGVADAHMDTLNQIIMYDATNLEETITEHTLRPMQGWNFPKSRHIRLKFVIDTEDDNAREQLEAFERAFRMGLRLKAKDIYDAIGASMPGPNDEVLSQQQQPPVGGMPGADPFGGDPGNNSPRGANPFGGGNDPSGPQPGQDGGPAEAAPEAAMAASQGPATAQYSRERYSHEWTAEDEAKHPRNHGQFAPKGSTTTGASADAPKKAKVKLEVKKMGQRYYALADLPDGKQITRSNEDEKEAHRLGKAEIEMHGHEVDTGEPEPPKGADKPRVKIDLNNFGGNRWYAMADLPGGGQVTRSHDDKAEAHRLAAGDVRAAGHEPHELDTNTVKPKPNESTGVQSSKPGSEGPRDGDRNAEGLVFRDGRWHRDDLEESDHGRETAKPELLETDRKSPDGRAESRVDRAAPAEPPILPFAETGGTGSGGRSPGLPESHGGVSRESAATDDGRGDGRAGSDGTGAEGSSATLVGRSGPHDGLGSGGSGRGHGGGTESVSRSLNESATPENPTDVSGANWRYHSRDFFQGGLKTKFQNNLDALRTMREITEEGRSSATPAEQEKLSKFVGWGQFPGLFNECWGDASRAGMSWEEFTKDKWSDERKAIKSLMSDDEWEAARKATLNSHFTHPSVVDAHWKMAQKLGFKGGRFLEPSGGIGYYLGLMPAELAGKTHASAVELDRVTGDMLSLLYPNANVEVKGFEKHQAPKGFYDLVASNVPFGDYRVHDPDYNKHHANIHDYFFLKSADLTKPGGLVMHVTSTGTMDKTDDRIRRELAKTCDFVAAVRFPSGAHQANAGTEVVTDMVILRKRHPGELPVTVDHMPPEAEAKSEGFTGTTTDSLGRVYHWVDGKRVPGPDWFSTKQVPDPDGGEPITVNAYFADHPEQVLGTLDRTGSMYHGKSVNVSKTDDYEDRLQAAIDRLPEGVVSTGINAVKGEPEQRAAGDEVKDGGYVIRDGKLFRREGGAEIEQHANGPQFARIAGQLAIRDAKQRVVDLETAGEFADEARAELNALYDAYVKKNGPLSNRDNRNAMKGDPDAPNLLALEKWNPTKRTAVKADMFTKETIRAHKQADHAENVGEGLGISLNETGGVDPSRIAELTGRPKDEVERELLSSGLAFEDPAEGWKPADQYLSGNVRQKLTLARAAAAADPKFRPNVEALEKVQPEDIDYQDIDIKLGASWVPASDVRQFAIEVGGLGYWGKDLKVNYVPETGDWQFSYKGRTTAAMDELGTSRKSFEDIMEATLNGKSLAIYDYDEKGGRHFNEVETRAVQEKANEIKERFGEWVWSDEERQNRLHRFYNDNFNNVRELKYNGSHLTLPGMRPDFKMRDIQKNFVWQVVSTGRGLAAHEVGTGKTASMIASAMELRRLGLAKKPMIAVMKANIEQITKEALELYPGAKILSTADKFDAQNRKRTIAQIATGDYDMVIMTHDQMDLLGMRPETEQQYINDELEELRAAKEAAWQDDPKKTNQIVKALEKAQAKLEAKLKKSIDSQGKDDAIYFEETGIDQIFVDEAHKYKSLPIYTKGERVKGVPQGHSDRATNMHMRAQWLQDRNGGRGVVFATGTPVANTMAELYNIQRYLQPKELKERGLTSFDAWASAFGDRQTEMEPTVTGDFAPVTRFSKFVNVPELMNIVSQVMDVERADDLKNPDGSPVVVRPKRADKIITTPLNEATERMMADINRRAQEVKGARPQKGADNMAVICSDGRKGSLDARMLYADAPDHPDSKLNQCVGNVLKLHKSRPETTQLIFSNVGVNPSPQTGFHLYGDLINKLVAGGIPRERIADFSQLEGPKKDAAQEAMRQGDIVVAIGSTEKLGTGVNVQNRVAAMHHLDVPWQPAEIEQRDGRGYRCGNRNDPTKSAAEQHVDIYRYVSEGSLDTFMWNLVGKKAHFISQVVHGRNKSIRSVSDEDTETLSPEQLMAVASGDPRVLRKVQLEADVRDLKMGAARHKRDQSKLHEKVKKYEADVTHHHGLVQKHAADVAHLASFGEKSEFSMRIGDTVHVDRKAADEALEKQIQEHDATPWYQREERGPIGEYKGFKIHLPGPDQRTESGVYLEGPSGHRYSARPTLASIEANLRGISGQHNRTAETVASLKKDLETIRGNIGKDYRRSAEFIEKQKQLKELEAELGGKKGSESDEPKSGETARYSRQARSLFDRISLAIAQQLASM